MNAREVEWSLIAWQRAALAALEAKRISPTDFVVAHALASYATYGTGCDARPSVETLASKSQVSESTARRSLQRLVRERLIVVTASGGGRNNPTTYRLSPRNPPTKREGLRRRNPRTGDRVSDP